MRSRSRPADASTRSRRPPAALLALAALFLLPPAVARARTQSASGDASGTPAAVSQDGPEAWSDAWDAVDRLQGADLAPDAKAALRATVEARIQAAPDSPRARLARVLLARIDGDAARTADPAALGLGNGPGDGAFRGREHWLVAAVLPPGPARVAAVLAGMDEAPFDSDPPRADAHVRLAWQTAVDEARALRLEHGALPIQLRLQEARPGAWSTVDLALTLGLLGRTDEADQRIAAEIAREAAAGPVDPELWNRRGLLYLGNGDERRGRDALGHALLLGSTNAALNLARLDLDAGRLEAARRGFRALSWEAHPGAWTQRGVGLSLLPPLPRRP